MKGKLPKKEGGIVTVPMFEKGMDFMAKSFAKVFDKLERHDQAFNIVLKEMQAFREEAREHRMITSELI